MLQQKYRWGGKKWVLPSTPSFHLEAVDLALPDLTPVSTWTTKTGYVFSASGAQRPTYRTLQQAGRPGVLFDGSANVMLGAASGIFATGFDYTKPFTTIACLSVLSSVPSFSRPLDMQCVFNQYQAGVSIKENLVNVYGYAGKGGVGSDSSNPVAYSGTGVRVVGGVFGPSLKAQMNTTISASKVTSGFPTTATTQNAGWSLGASWYAGALYWPFNGMLYEMCIWESALSDADMIQAARYFGQKYNFTV